MKTKARRVTGREVIEGLHDYPDESPVLNELIEAIDPDSVAHDERFHPAMRIIGVARKVVESHHLVGLRGRMIPEPAIKKAMNRLEFWLRNYEGTSSEGEGWLHTCDVVEIET